uniref:Uncharacterized protein n=1 Tax=Astyanax mexicanus TaxID=7994 RepID=A0A3B1KD84_ASTMX
MSDKGITYAFKRYKGEPSFLMKPIKYAVLQTPKEDPWSRLSETPTFSSKRRSVYSDDNPIDSLDLKLTSVYDQSKDFLSSKNKVVLQSETLGIKPEELQEPEALQEEPCRLPRCTTGSVKPQMLHSLKSLSMSQKSSVNLMN